MEITVHMLVQNEDQFIWYALMSVIDHVKQIYITDNGSTDHTLELIKRITSPKIILEEKKPTDRAGLVARRRDQIQKTKTPWFMILDGDEIWPKENLLKYLNTGMQSGKETVGVACRTRNCVGDIWHYQPENAGKYQLKGKTGHLTTRLMKSGVTLQGEYPNEAFVYNGRPIQEQDDILEWSDTWYLHTTHLHRSSVRKSDEEVIDRVGKFKREMGIQLSKAELPEVFFESHRPTDISDPLNHRLTYMNWFTNAAITPLKYIKRSF